jgi:aconitate hydratase
MHPEELMPSKNSLNSQSKLKVGSTEHTYYSIANVPGANSLPFSLKVLLENLLRTEDGANVTKEQITSLANWDPAANPDIEIQFTPARVIMQDFTGVPCVVDLATMREAVSELGGDPKRVNPLAPAELVIDHSVIVDFFNRPDAFELNVKLEYERNNERYKFLRWGQGAFDEFKVVPPGTGIVHQVNIEHLARVVMSRNGEIYPDTCVGTDSHTTMVNGLGVLGWGVGGIEAEAAMLGQPVSMLIPRVVGFKLRGALQPGVTATDLVLVITEMLREHKVVGKFVEFYGDGVAQVPLANRATIGNMSPEYGSTVAIFPIDQETLNYLTLTGRSAEQVALVEQYAKAQGLWHDPAQEARYSEYIELDLATVEPSIAGPKRPQDRILVKAAKHSFNELIPSYATDVNAKQEIIIDGESVSLTHGKVVVAAITSCTNTSNPEVMLGAGLLAKKAVAKGLKRAPWVKTSLAPGSQVVTDYLDRAKLTKPLNELGFDLVGYGCTTCIGNSGPLPAEVSQAVQAGDLAVAAVLSGNRNFEGRINPDVKLNYLASPLLVVAYAIAGTMDIDLMTEPLGYSQDGSPVMLADVWPSTAEIQAAISESIDVELFTNRYKDVFKGDASWQNLPTPTGKTFDWDPKSTYVRKPPYFENMKPTPAAVQDVVAAKVLAKLGDSVTTDHISPAGSIKKDSPAGKYLMDNGVEFKDFNSYGSRRGNHEVMIRGTFANIRLKNELADGKEGGFTKDFTKPDQPIVSIYDAAQAYAAEQTPLVVLAGKEYGSGSSRDWAAKGTALLGVKAVIAESYERIHRSNLVGMGVLPLQYQEGQHAQSLGLIGDEEFSITGVTALNNGTTPKTVSVIASAPGRADIKFECVVRIDTPREADYYRNGGILQYVLRNLVSA